MPWGPSGHSHAEFLLIVMALIDLEIVYLKNASRVNLPAGEALLGEAERIGSEVAASIAAGDFEPRPDRRKCPLCSYRLLCPAAL